MPAESKYMSYTEIADIIVNRHIARAAMWYPAYNKYLAKDRATEPGFNHDDIDRFQLPDRERHLAKQFLDAMQDQSAEAADFLARLRIITSVLDNTDNPTETKMFLKNIDRISDPVVSHNVLRRIASMWFMNSNRDNDIARDATIMATQNPNATAADYLDLLYMREYHNQAELDSIMAAIDKILEKDLATEMAREVPDLEKIRKITENMSEAHSRASKAQSEKKTDLDYATTLKKKYNFDKIVQTGAKYIPQYQAGLEQEMADIRAQSAERDAEIAELRRQISEMERGIRTRDEQISQLTQEKEKLITKNSGLETKFKSASNDIKTLIAAADAVRGGIGAKGVSNLQKTIETIKDTEYN